jgi:hypothetical protein
VQVQEVPEEPVSEWKWRVLVEFYSLVIPSYVLASYVLASRKITNAKANVADRIISNDLVNLKVFWS